METAEQLAEMAVRLQPAERLRLIEAILFSLDKVDPNVEQNWVAEAEARHEAYKRGELGTVSWDEIGKRHQD